MARGIYEPALVYEDNSSALNIINGTETSVLRFLLTKQYAIRQAVQNGEIEMRKISTADQLADIMMKALDRSKFETICTFLLMSAQKCFDFEEEIDKMVVQFIAQALRNAEDLKQRILCSKDLINDNEATTARLQLQKTYQQILLLDLEYAIEKKIEQDLWNIGFKNYIDILQKLVKDKKNPKRNEYQGLLNMCLESASGFYSMLLEEICVTFSFSLPFPSYRKYSYLQSDTKKSQLEHLIEQPKKTSCCYICQHCLVHLGDIARYRFRCKQAEIFYRNAIILSPSSGQPYNQLALLETSRGDKLATVFYYVRSIAVRNPFPAANSNLTLTLKKANDATDGWNPESESILSTSDFITLFLRVHAILHFSNDILPCSTYVRLLSTSLTAHVATESFTSIHLVQMMVINMYAYQNVNSDAGRAVEDNQLASDDKLIKTLLTELIVGSLNAFLLPIYTYKQEDSLLQYFALPAIKITLDWIRINPHVLDQSSFINRPQIWPAFCKLLNDIGSLLNSFSQEKYKNVTLPEDQDIQGFLPLQSAIPEFRYIDNELDLDSLSKVRACRIRDFAFWLANETKYSLIEVGKKESEFPQFNATITGTHSSNEMIIQQLEDLLKNDCKITTDSSVEDNGSSSLHPVTKSVCMNFDSTSPSISSSTESKRTGILKTQSFLDKKEKSFSGDARKPSRQNVALQTILKRNQEQEHKQVTFKTPSPSLSTSSDNPESASPSVVNHSQLWPNNTFAPNNLSHPPLQQQQSHSVFMPSFASYNDPFRKLPSSLQQQSQQQPQQQQQNINFKMQNNPPFYQSTMNSVTADIQRGFAAGQIYQKPATFLANDRLIDPFATGNQINSSSDVRRQNVAVDGNLLTQLPDSRHLQHSQFTSTNQISNMNFLPPWKQQEPQPNPWWIEEKQKVIGSSILEDQSNSLFHYRTPSTVSPSTSLQFGAASNQLQFPVQQPQIGPQIRQISQPPLPNALQQPQQQSPQQSQQLGLRGQTTPNIPVGYWPSTFKQSPPQNNVNSIFNTSLLSKPPLFETTYNQQSTNLTGSDDKSSFTSHSQLPNNTYSLFSPMWNTPGTNENQANQPSNNNPLAVLTHQSIWSSEGISPLQRLLEQQKQMRDRSMYNSQPSPAD